MASLIRSSLILGSETPNISVRPRTPPRFIGQKAGFLIFLGISTPVGSSTDTSRAAPQRGTAVQALHWPDHDAGVLAFSEPCMPPSIEKTKQPSAPICHYQLSVSAANGITVPCPPGEPVPVLPNGMNPRLKVA